jgi:hypothetical protein
MFVKSLTLLFVAILSVFSALGQAASDFNSLNGALIRESEASPHIYYVLDGKKCHVPSEATLHRLFGFSPHIQFNLGLRYVPDGPALSDQAILIRAVTVQEPRNSTPPTGSTIRSRFQVIPWANTSIYLLNHGQKRGIVSLDALKKYQFSDRYIEGIPLAAVEAIPTGDPIN